MTTLRLERLCVDRAEVLHPHAVKPASFPIASATAWRYGWRSLAVELKNTVVKCAIQVS